jgi:hypothetical protein
MVKNETTNRMELNLQETHLMRRIDEKCTVENPVQIEVNDAAVTIRADRNDFSAATVWNGELMVAFGATASGAFLNLIERLKK